SNTIFALPGHSSTSSVGRKSNDIFALPGHGSTSSIGRKSNAIFALSGHGSTSSIGRKSNAIFALSGHGSTSSVGLYYTGSAFIIINPSAPRETKRPSTITRHMYVGAAYDKALLTQSEDRYDGVWLESVNVSATHYSRPGKTTNGTTRRVVRRQDRPDQIMLQQYHWYPSWQLVIVYVLGNMSSQTRYSFVIDDDTRHGLKDTIQKLMREELGKLWNEMVEVAMADNNGVMVQRGMQNMPKFGVWHKNILSIMGENVAWISYKKAIVQRFGNSFDGSSMAFSSSNSVKDSSLNTRLVDKLEELLVNDSHASDKIDKNIGNMVLDKAFKECDNVEELELKDTSEVDDGC
ncbi:hypothetical protein Tco_1380727, partial [Tanacetum coccineum]